MRNVSKVLKSKDPKVLFILAALLILIAYIFASLAVDTGNLLYYLATFIVLVYGLKYFFRGAYHVASHGKKR